MTKSQIISALTSKYASVADENKWEEITNPGIVWAINKLGLKLIAIPVIEERGDSKMENHVQVITDGINYSWRGNEPKIGSLADRLNTFISNKIADGTIQFGVIKDLNKSIGRATVQVYMPDNSSKLLLVTEAADGTITHKVIA